METAYLSLELSSVSSKCENMLTNQLTPVESTSKVIIGGTARDIHSETTDTVQHLQPAFANQADIKDEQNEKCSELDKKTTVAEEIKRKISSMTMDEFIAAVHGNLASVKSVRNYSANIQLNELRFFKIIASLPASEKHKKHKGLELLANEDIISIFKLVVDSGLKVHFVSDDYKSTFNNMYSVLVTLWNGTDASKLLCKKAVDAKLYEDIFNYLDGRIPFQGGANSNKRQITMLKGCLGILNNIVQKCDVTMLFRECNGVQIVERYTESEDQMLKCKALMLLAHIVDEEDTEKLKSNEKAFSFLIKILGNTLKNDSHWSKVYGYNAYEIVDALNRLAANDANKQRIVQCGALKYYTQLLQGNVREKKLAARGIWTLAFKAKKEILQEENCVKFLKALVEKSNDASVQKQAAGALWILEGKSGESHTGSEESEDKGESFHIMISYQWDNQPIILELKNKLEQAGFKVWMDVEKMSGSILEAMAQAIEQSAVVLVCMSQKYKESPNCRTEGDYAFTKHKTIIPLVMQYRYKPNGWLGALVGSLLYFDFSQEKKYNSSFDGLVKELRERGLTDNKKIVPVKDIAQVQHSPSNNFTKAKCMEWSESQVKVWLEDNKLHEISDKFSSIDGSLLYEYKLMFSEAPEFFYKSLETSLQLSLTQILRFSKAIRNL